MTVFTDRAQGGVSRRSGQFELMIERKIDGSDHRGVEQRLNDNFNLAVKHRLLFQVGDLDEDKESQYQHKIDKRNLAFFGFFEKDENLENQKIPKNETIVEDYASPRDVMERDFGEMSLRVDIQVLSSGYEFLLRLFNYKSGGVRAVGLGEVLKRLGFNSDMIEFAEEMHAEGVVSKHRK